MGRKSPIAGVVLVVAVFTGLFTGHGSGTTTGTETLVTAGGCSGLGTVLSCTDSPLTNGQAYFYKVAAANAIGTGAQSGEISATPTAPTGAQLLGNPGFETGTAAPWTASTGVISNSSTELPHGGSWDAWLDGYGATHTDTLAQSITIPAAATSATLSLWLHIDTAETTTTTAYDTSACKSSTPAAVCSPPSTPGPTSTPPPATARRALTGPPTKARPSPSSSPEPRTPPSKPRSWSTTPP